MGSHCALSPVSSQKRLAEVWRGLGLQAFWSLLLGIAGLMLDLYPLSQLTAGCSRLLNHHPRSRSPSMRTGAAAAAPVAAVAVAAAAAALAVAGRELGDWPRVPIGRCMAGARGCQICGGCVTRAPASESFSGPTLPCGAGGRVTTRCPMFPVLCPLAGSSPF